MLNIEKEISNIQRNKIERKQKKSEAAPIATAYRQSHNSTRLIQIRNQTALIHHEPLIASEFRSMFFVAK